MDKACFLRKLRLFLVDPDGKVWDDIELNTFLDEALEKYCIDSGCLVSEFKIFPDSNGIYHYPENFGKFLIGWNESGEEIQPATARELFMRSYYCSTRTGYPEYIYDDLVSHGEFSLYPNPLPTKSFADITITPDYGEILDNTYGVYLFDGYGTTLTISQAEYIGTVYYSKVGDYESIKDYMSVICYALYLAYNADSDFANADMASYWEGMYKSRLGVFSRVLHNNAGNTVSVNFY